MSDLAVILKIKSRIRRVILSPQLFFRHYQIIRRSGGGRVVSCKVAFTLARIVWRGLDKLK